MEEWLSPQTWIDEAESLWAWVQANVLTWTTAIQISTAALAFGAALLLLRRVQPWLTGHRAHPSFGRAIGVLLPLLFPLLWLVLDWIGLAIVRYVQTQIWLLDSIAGLLAAWVMIRLVSQLVRNPVLANIFVWAAWSIAALNLLGWLDNVIDLLDDARLFRLSDRGTPNDDSDDVWVSLYTIARWTISLLILMSIAVYLSSFLEGRIRTIRTLSPSLQVLFVKSLKIVLVTLAIVIAVTSAGFDLTALAVFGGALGVGVGFGLQRVVSNLISGVILLLDKSIKPGDVIAVSGTYGWVTALGGRYVSVVTRDGVEHLIPNELLMSERVENWTHTHSRTRLKANVGVHYRTDVRKAMALCLEAADETDRVLNDPEPKCLLIEFGDSSVNLQLRFWIADAHNGVQNVTSAVLLAIWDKFQAAGIEIPYPQRDLHLRSGFETLNPAS